MATREQSLKSMWILPDSLQKRHPVIWLNQNGSVNWQWSYDKKGNWWYSYNPITDEGILFIEFAGGVGTWKRHAFLQLVSEKHILLEKEHEIYNQAESGWSTSSIVHTNQAGVLLEKLKWPRRTECVLDSKED